MRQAYKERGYLDWKFLLPSTLALLARGRLVALYHKPTAAYPLRFLAILLCPARFLYLFSDSSFPPDGRPARPVEKPGPQ